MQQAPIPGHSLPTYNETERKAALFHYTTADGLMGILSDGALRVTAFHCANDLAELDAGKGGLSPIFSEHTHKLIKSDDERVQIFRNRGVDVREYGNKFEQSLTSFSLNVLRIYISCFCIAKSKEDFHHGLLSQWRGYGVDGGYALQINRDKLSQRIKELADGKNLNLELQDVHYSKDNLLRDKMTEYSSEFVAAYEDHLDYFAAPIDSSSPRPYNPIKNLFGGPLESMIDYLIHTKNHHFAEENECRLSAIDSGDHSNSAFNLDFYNRSGLVVPYILLTDFNILDFVEWIIIGPGPRLADRMRSLTQMVRYLGLKISVRPSHIPYDKS